MAKPKAKAHKAPANKNEKKLEKKSASGVFKTRKTREPEQTIGDTLTPPEEIQQAIDAFREAQEQAKHFEGEMTIQKDAINEYSLTEFAKRVLKGKPRSFKLLGEQSMVTYVVMDASAGLTEDDVEAFRDRWGEKAAEELITPDFASIRFDGEVLEANYDAIVKALESLPKEILENLFKPMLLRAKPGAVERAKHYAKTPEDLREIIQQLKIRNYIR